MSPQLLEPGVKMKRSRQSEVLVEALRACGSDVRFTLYPDANHDGSWKLAYADPELWEWLLEQEIR